MSVEAKVKAKKIITEKTKSEFLKRVEGIPKNKRAALVVHKNPPPDFDALAGAISIKYFFDLKEIESDIFVVGPVSHLQNRTLVKKMDIELKDEEFFKENRQQYALIIFIDTEKKNASLDVKPDIIINHHPEEEIIPGCLIIRKIVGAASTLVYLLLKKLEVKLSPEIATALATGINVDTKGLTGDETTEIDKQVHKELLSQVDYELFEIFNFRYERPHALIRLMGRAFKKDIFYDDIAVINAGEITDGQEDLCAEIADFVMRTKGTDLVVMIALKNGGIIHANVRTDLDSIQIDEFCKTIFEVNSVTDAGRPSAGGRKGSGGAQVPLSRREREEFVIAKERGMAKEWFDVKVERYKRAIIKEAQA